MCCMQIYVDSMLVLLEIIFCSGSAPLDLFPYQYYSCGVDTRSIEFCYKQQFEHSFLVGIFADVIFLCFILFNNLNVVMHLYLRGMYHLQSQWTMIYSSILLICQTVYRPSSAVGQTQPHGCPSTPSTWRRILPASWASWKLIAVK